MGQHFFLQWRLYRHLSQERAARVIGIDRAHLSRIERGKDPYSERIVTGMAEAYRCAPVDLLARDPADPEGVWAVWNRIQPERRKEALRLLMVLVEEPDDTR